jgi:hypothetical protein
MNIYESVAKMEMDQQTACKSGYIKDINAEIVLTRTCLRITDLTNALKVGKTCKEFVLYFENYNQDFYMIFTDYVYNNKLKLETIVKNILDFRSTRDSDQYKLAAEFTIL